MTDRRYEQLSWKIGKVSITRLVEVVIKAPIPSLFPDRSAAELAAYDDWLRPNFLDADGDMILSIHAFLINVDGLNIIVDTCAGNGKKLPLYDEWVDMNTPFLENMAKLGFPADKIDRVLCTHLHFDHVGWNTHLVDGKWVPTFPNARYLFGAAEWDFWKDEEDPYGSHALDHALQPIFDAELVDLVDSSHKICDEISLIPTPGHTPGHVSIHIQSEGEEAVITGDMFHHPLQMAKPGWIDGADVESSLAEKTRIEFMQRFGDSETTVLGTHFATPTAGKIVSDGPGYKFES
ncbi:MAG: MBL fold metallo-hydrolase [Gammaproteobacteria bacterium]|nr:MAG: MBL fold metallo-hydrolase [Gammaproteobacteria bacterium]